MQSRIGKDYVMLSGFVARDAEYAEVGQKQTPLCKFSVKVGERREEGADKSQAIWASVVCWRDMAYAAQSVLKGDTVFVIGELKTRTYTGKDGEEKTATDVICEFFSKAETGAHSVPHEAAAPSSSTKDFEEIVSDDDLPF